MSTEILVALTALAGTLLGAVLNGLSKFFDTWWMQKVLNKERHEEVVRAILVEFIPSIRLAISFSESYESATRPDFMEQNIFWFDKAILLYENEVKKQVPLNMIKEMSDLNLCLDHLKALIGFNDPTLKEKYKELLLRTEEMVKEIEIIIDTKYR